MIIYKDMKTGHNYYDTSMISNILKMSKSKLKRELASYTLADGDYLVYNNRFLLTQKAVTGFIYHLVTKNKK